MAKNEWSHRDHTCRDAHCLAADPDLRQVSLGDISFEDEIARALHLVALLQYETMPAVLEPVRDQELSSKKRCGGARGRILGNAAPRCKHARAERRLLAVTAARIDIGGVNIGLVLVEAGRQGAPGRLAGARPGEDSTRSD